MDLVGFFVLLDGFEVNGSEFFVGIIEVLGFDLLVIGGFVGDDLVFE